MMELAQEYFVEEPEFTEEVFSDPKAEQYLRRIADLTAETQRLVNVCDTAIAEYEFKKKCYQESLEKKTAFMKSQLFSYFMTVNRKKTKTGESYELPSGKIKLKYSTPEYIRDETLLVQWLEEQKKDEYIKIKKSPDWAGLKNKTSISGSVVTDEDGQIIEGVSVVMKPERFDIEF